MADSRSLFPAWCPIHGDAAICGCKPPNRRSTVEEAKLCYHDRLHAALEELLDVAERIRGGDANLDPERWYAARDYARVVLAATPGDTA